MICTLVRDVIDAVLQKVKKNTDPNNIFNNQKMTEEKKKKIKILKKLTKIDTAKVIK